MSHVTKKLIFTDSDQIPLKLVFTATEKGWKLEISDLRRWIVLVFVVKTKMLISCAVLCLCFCIYARIYFSQSFCLNVFFVNPNKLEILFVGHRQAV